MRFKRLRRRTNNCGLEIRAGGGAGGTRIPGDDGEGGHDRVGGEDGVWPHEAARADDAAIALRRQTKGGGCNQNGVAHDEGGAADDGGPDDDVVLEDGEAVDDLGHGLDVVGDENLRRDELAAPPDEAALAELNALKVGANSSARQHDAAAADPEKLVPGDVGPAADQVERLRDGEVLDVLAAVKKRRCQFSKH